MVTQRSYEVDVIRMASLIGICLVNIPFMALPVTDTFNLPSNSFDRYAVLFVSVFFQLKFFLLFSFIFGWGMSVQLRSLERRGESFNRVYLRRMAGLLFLGMLHAIFVFSGDILVLYSMVGVVLWLFRSSSIRRLLSLAAWMLPVSVIFLTVLAVILDSATSATIAEPKYSLGGSYTDTVLARVYDLPATLVSLILLQGPLVLSAFALGLAAGRSNFFLPGNSGFQRLEKLIPWLLVIGLVLNGLFALASGDLFEQEWLAFIGFVGIAIGAPMLSAVYLYLLVRLARTITNIPKLLLLAGQNSLSSYALQGVLAGFVFGGYGLGWFGQLGQFDLLGVALVISIVAMMMIGAYASIFGSGPLEPILRFISGRRPKGD